MPHFENFLRDAPLIRRLHGLTAAKKEADTKPSYANVVRNGIAALFEKGG
jgi:hypothetical protein